MEKQDGSRPEGKFKLKVFFKDGNERTFKSYDWLYVKDGMGKKHLVEDQKYGFERLQKLVKQWESKIITALIYTNDEKNILIQKYVGKKLEYSRMIKFS